MNLSRTSSSRYLGMALFGVLLASAACKSKQPAENSGSGTTVPVQIQPNAPLSANDVSWLFPAPTKAADFANLIAVRDIPTPNPQDPTKRDPVWPDAVFQQFLAIDASPAAQVA